MTDTPAPPTWEPTRVKLRDLKPWERNPRRMSKVAAERLLRSWRELGQVQTIAIGPDGEVYDGHQRLSALRSVYGDDYEVLALRSSRPLTEAERERLVLMLHAGAMGEWDWGALANWDAETLLDGGIDEALRDVLKRDLKAIDNLLDSMAADTAPPDAEDDVFDDDGAAVPIVALALDFVFPTDNDYGIPLLDAEMQANALVAPAGIWGHTKRKTRFTGTCFFYTEDYRYERLWKSPQDVVNTGANCAVEPNFSVYDEMPAAIALYQIYRKRWIARFWQMYGIRVFVDLNVSERHADLNLLGVPRGWRAFATRGYTDRLDATEREYKRACEIAGGEPVFVVYGGGQAVAEACKAHGWTHIPEVMDGKR